MLSKKIIVAALCSLLANTSYANWDQHVKTCLTVNNNTSGHGFSSAFRSSDIFDGDWETGGVSKGTKCVEHTYHHGPKHLSFYAGGGPLGGMDTTIVRDESCVAFANNANNQISIPSKKIRSHHVAWHFSLTQTGTNPDGGRKKNMFTVSCRQEL